MTVSVGPGISSVGVFGGATVSVAGLLGLVPAPAAGDQAKTLLGDGTWGTLIAGLTGTKAEFDLALTDGDFVYQSGPLGEPSSGVATNLTGTAAGLTAGLVTTNANLTGPITSTGNATAITSPMVINAINGGTAANDDITIQGTSNATRTTSYVNLQPNGGGVLIGTTSSAGTPGPLKIKANTSGVYASFFNAAAANGGVLTFADENQANRATFGITPSNAGNDFQVERVTGSAGSETYTKTLKILNASGRILAGTTLPTDDGVSDFQTGSIKGTTITASQRMVPGSYTVALVPSPARGLIEVTNDVGGITIAHGDNTNWRRVYDNAIVTT